MPTLCSHCSALYIESLLDLARRDFSAHSFPKEAYHKYHKSFDDLERSAHDGCDFCRLVLECFQRTPCFDEIPLMWPEGWLQTPNTAQEGYPNTMYSVAKCLEVSDVRLCLDASHLYSGQDIDGVQVFDEIMIQVRSDYVEDDDGYAELFCPPLSLKFIAERGESEKTWTITRSNTSTMAKSDILEDQIVKIDRTRIGRYRVDDDLASSFNHRLAREWLSQCRLSHTDCLVQRMHELPTRVIDVANSSDLASVRLVLSHGMKAEYVALSHCWGGAISPLLTTQTLASFQESIAMASLRANFRDAIIINRNLGIRYLWIDSLCIQQDSKSDWEKESKKMGLVYRNSTVTISAVVSAGSKAGILKSKVRASNSRSPVALKIFKDESEPRQVMVCRKHLNEENMRGLDISSALMRRGWTLQEYILSPDTFSTAAT